MRFAPAALLGLLAALALGSCGGGGEAVRTATVSLTAASLPTRTAPAVVETVTLTETAPAVTETVTQTDAAPALPGGRKRKRSRRRRP